MQTIDRRLWWVEIALLNLCAGSVISTCVVFDNVLGYAIHSDFMWLVSFVVFVISLISDVLCFMLFEMTGPRSGLDKVVFGFCVLFGFVIMFVPAHVFMLF